MAKELPYFKFEPAEYLTKDISFCSLSAQGLFINICSYYWQRNCKITKEQLLKRLDYKDEFNELIIEGVIDLNENEYIIIKFLDNQLTSVEEKSKTNSANGSKGGRPKKNIELNPIESETKPKLNPIESETKGIREDKIREDKIKEENINTALPFKFFDSLLNYGFNKELISDWLKVRKTKKATNTKIAFDKFIIEVEKSNLDKNLILETCIEKSWSGFKSEWINNLNINKKITNEQLSSITSEIRRNNPNI